jgi:hypothetical protein
VREGKYINILSFSFFILKKKGLIHMKIKLISLGVLSLLMFTIIGCNINNASNQNPRKETITEEQKVDNLIDEYTKSFNEFRSLEYYFNMHVQDYSNGYLGHQSFIEKTKGLGERAKKLHESLDTRLDEVYKEEEEGPYISEMFSSLKDAALYFERDVNVILELDKNLTINSLTLNHSIARHTNFRESHAESNDSLQIALEYAQKENIDMEKYISKEKWK